MADDGGDCSEFSIRSQELPSLTQIALIEKNVEDPYIRLPSYSRRPAQRKRAFSSVTLDTILG